MIIRVPQMMLPPSLVYDEAFVFNGRHWINAYSIWQVCDKGIGYHFEWIPQTGEVSVKYNTLHKNVVGTFYVNQNP